MEAVVKLSLEGPLELRVIKVPGVEFEIIRMHWNRGIFEIDQDFDAFAFGASCEIQQRMLIQLQLRKNAIEPRIGHTSHPMILTGVAVVRARWEQRDPSHS